MCHKSRGPQRNLKEKEKEKKLPFFLQVRKSFIKECLLYARKT